MGATNTVLRSSALAGGTHANRLPPARTRDSRKINPIPLKPRQLAAA
jgi:hypothetical protein